MSDSDGQELVTKPFKFVTAGKPTFQRNALPAPTPVSPIKTRPSTAGKTTSITTSASSPRVRTSLLAASSGTPTAPCAPLVGTSAGTSSEREATSPSSSMLKQLPFVAN